MKKFAVIALAAVMLLSTLAGCGANAEGEASVQSVSMICGLSSTGKRMIPPRWTPFW